MTRWLRRQFAENRPYDAVRPRHRDRRSGSDHGRGAGRVLQGAEHAGGGEPRRSARCSWACASSAPSATTIPSEKWSQDDYFGLAGLLHRRGRQAAARRGGGDRLAGGHGPRTTRGRSKPRARPGRSARAHAKFTTVDDRRTVLADWMTAPDNPFFAPAIANRSGRTTSAAAWSSRSTTCGHQPRDQRAAAGRPAPSTCARRSTT